MNLSKKDQGHILHALQVARVRMQEDALSAILYNSDDFGRAVISKMAEFEELAKRVSEEAE
jgi:hypothetical protein